MKSWNISESGAIALEEQNINTEGLVKVKVTKVPLMPSDLSVFFGKANTRFPIVPGRIAAGLVSEADPMTGFRKGEKVFVSPYQKLQKGETVVKVHGVDLNGYLSDYVVVPFEDVYSLPEGVTDEQAIFIENIAIAINAIETIDLEAHEYLTILGANAQGLITAQLANYYHAVPIIVDKDEAKLELAREAGVCYCINSDKQDVTQRVLEITGGRMADCTVFECRSGLTPQFAFNLTKKRGKVGIIGLNVIGNKLNADIRTILAKELTVVGISTGYGELSSALNLLANEAVNLDGLIEQTIPFEQAGEYMAGLSADAFDGRLRVVFNCD